jgi:chaperone BCS1
VTGWALVFGCHTAGRYLYDLVQGYFDEYYTSSIQINDDDALFSDVKAWLSEQQEKKSSRKLKAVTEYEDKKKDEIIHDAQGIYKYKVPMPRYEPSYGSDGFFHDGRRFRVVRSSVKDEAGSYMRETLEIYCYARTAQPVKDLLAQIREWQISQETAMTGVWRAMNNGGRYWSRQSTRPSRPMHTVSLDQQQKDDIVEDINEYLHPATARWYAARGIPHRRGVIAN